MGEVARPLKADERDRYRPRIDRGAVDDSHLVQLQGKDGRVFLGLIYAMWLGTDHVTAGDHKGLVWWPVDGI